MRGPAITIKCDCGNQQPVGYGASWTCPGCDRTWNTAQIPAEEYWGSMRALRRYRRTVWTIAAVVTGTLIPLAVLVSPAFFVLLIVLLGGLYLVVLPKWRARVLAQLRDRPTWNLRPE